VQIYKRKCDNCGKETTDRYVEPGWIELSASGGCCSINVSISIQRNQDGIAKTAYLAAKEWDFCCMACMVEFFTDLFNKRRKALCDI
jgi:hypothetical protein